MLRSGPQLPKPGCRLMAALSDHQSYLSLLSYWSNSGHWAALGRAASVANDPQRTSETAHFRYCPKGQCR